MKLRFPKSRISRAFLRYTKPVAQRQKRLVYAFVEISRSDGGLSTFDFLRDDETGVIPVTIGRYTRAQLAKLEKSQLDLILSLVLPGTNVIRVVGFGHALTRTERKGIRFTRAKGRRRKTRGTGNKSRNKPTKGRKSKRRSRRRV